MIESISTEHFECQFYSISKVGKEKNGDHLAILQLPNEGLLIAMVADGVSQQPKDWLASEMTCECFANSFKVKSKLNLKNRLLQSIEETNKTLIKTGTKMASTLSVLVYDYRSRQIHWSSIGDSRIYKITEEVITCLTEDDSIIQSRMISSTRNSFEEKREVLSAVIGQVNIDIEVNSGSLAPETLLLLATDGFYNARPASFLQRVRDFSNQADFKKAFTTMVSQFEMLRGDDMTVIAIKTR